MRLLFEAVVYSERSSEAQRTCDGALQHPMTTLIPRGVDWHAYTIQEDQIFLGPVQAFAIIMYVYRQTPTLLLLALNK